MSALSPHPTAQAPERDDELAPRLAFGLWGMRGVRTFARVTAEYRDGKVTYLGVAGHTTTEASGERDAVVTEEQATSEAAWTALVGELKARRGRR